MFWLVKGNENTKFFHAGVFARKKTNHITHLVDAHGVRVENHNDMYDIVRNYFTEVFAREVEEVVGAQIISTRSIIVEQNSKLAVEVSFEEFTDVVKQMHPKKTSGPNGKSNIFSKFLAYHGTRSI